LKKENDMPGINRRFEERIKQDEFILHFTNLLKQIRPLPSHPPKKKEKKGGRGYTKSPNKKKNSKRVRLARQRGLHPRKPLKRDR
jgi:hypothetical protein